MKTGFLRIWSLFVHRIMIGRGKCRKSLVSLGFLCLYVVCTVLMTWPLTAHLSSSLSGDSSDAYINPWANWWTQKALSEGLDFYTTDYIFYPQKVSLVFHSFSHVNTFLWFLLRPCGDLAAYNLTVMLGYTLSGWGMYCLVKYLVRSNSAAFVGGLVFAFAPCHLAEGDHPVLLSAQWIPLFILYFIRLLRTGAWSDILLAVFFFFLNALTSWHLMTFAALGGLFYLIYVLLFERERLSQRWLKSLLLFGFITAAGLFPLLYPLLREQLAAGGSFMAVSLEEGGKGNDLLAFFVPAMGHPFWGRFLTSVYDRLGYTVGRLKRPSGYLGYTALMLAIYGVLKQRRAARFWFWSGLVFVLLSLNAHLSVAGQIYDDVQMPWAGPVVAVLRHPFRFNLMISFSMAVLVGLGWSELQRRITGKRMVALVTLLIATLILFESLVWPWPITPVHVSPFYHSLAAEGGDFALITMPMGRARSKEYMYYQTLHGHKLVEGAISRTPHNAYDFFASSPLLSAAAQGEPLDSIQTPLLGQMDYLVNHNFRYIILHKARMEPKIIARWQAYFVLPPFYEDDQLIAYRTKIDQESFMALDHDLSFLVLDSLPTVVTQGDRLTLDVAWLAESSPERDWGVALALMDAGGRVAQMETFSQLSASPTSSWTAGTVVAGQYVFQVSPSLSAGEYRLVLALVEPISGIPTGCEVVTHFVTVEPLP